jgi:hypothetical protein
LVALAVAAGIPVVPIPGVSALATIVSIAGIDMREFVFLGFPPHKKGRETFFRKVAMMEYPVMYYESPHRVMKNLDLLETFAPWNIGSYTFSQKGEEIFVDGQPVIFYHFHALKKLGPGLYDTGIAPYRTPCSPLVRRLIYSPYIRELQKIRTWLKKTYGFQADVGTVRKENSPMKSLPLAISRLRKGQWLIRL